MEQALAGVRVLDLSENVAGPYCSRVLAGFGAEVIKVERPGEGDSARRCGPFLDDIPGAERSGLFLYLNTNKKSITLNLKSRAGVKIFKDLVRQADVVVESFAPGKIERLGLGYRTLEKITPGLVMTSITGFGQTGPYRDYKMTHLLAWVMNGSRYTNGQPEKPPWQGPNWMSDYMTGGFGVTGTLMALYQKNATGIGQQVDVSMFESMQLMSLHPGVIFSMQGIDYTRHGVCWIGVFKCQDGYVGINMLTQAQFNAICEFFGVPELACDPKYANLSLIVDHIEELRALFGPKVAPWNKKDLFQAAVEWRIPAGLIQDAKDIIESPQNVARGFLEEVTHPVMGKVVMPGAPYKLTGTPWVASAPAPLLGQNNEEIYCGCMGFSRADLVRLGEEGVI